MTEKVSGKEMENAIIVLLRRLWEVFSEKYPKLAWWISGCAIAVVAAVMGFITYMSEFQYPENETPTNTTYVDNDTCNTIMSPVTNVHERFVDAAAVTNDDTTGTIAVDTNDNAAVWVKEEH